MKLSRHPHNLTEFWEGITDQDNAITYVVENGAVVEIAVKIEGEFDHFVMHFRIQRSDQSRWNK